MHVGEIVLRGAGSLCVAWTLLHIHRATSSPNYEAPIWISGTRSGEPSRLLDYVDAIAVVVGFVLIGVQIVYLLVWWMPYEWGDNVDGEFRRTRDYLQTGVGGVLGLGLTTLLTHVGPKRR